MVVGGACCAPRFDQVSVHPQPLSADEVRKALVGRIEASGELPATLKPIVQSTADALFNQTFDPLAKVSKRIDGTRCFQGGCVFEVVYRDRCAQRAANAALTRDGQAALRRWPGAIIESPPVRQADGQVTVTWALQIANPGAKREKLVAAARPITPRTVFVPDLRCAADTNPTNAAPSTNSPAPAKSTEVK